MKRDLLLKLEMKMNSGIVQLLCLMMNKKFTDLKGCNKIFQQGLLPSLLRNLSQSVESRGVKFEGESLQNPSISPKIKRHKLLANCKPSQLKDKCSVSIEPLEGQKKIVECILGKGRTRGVGSWNGSLHT